MVGSKQQGAVCFKKFFFIYCDIPAVKMNGGPCKYFCNAVKQKLILKRKVNYFICSVCRNINGVSLIADQQGN